MLLVLLPFGWHVRRLWENRVSAADALVVEVDPRYATGSDRQVDWIAVCQWIRDNTPPDSLWFTPKYQQSFKWYAERAEVVCWKDVPQDNAAVLEWFQRIEECARPARRPRKNTRMDHRGITEIGRQIPF